MKDVITYWNRGAETLYGWTRDEALGKVTDDLLQTIFPAPPRAITATLTRDGHWEGELVHTRRDGGRVVVASRPVGKARRLPRGDVDHPEMGHVVVDEARPVEHVVEPVDVAIVGIGRVGRLALRPDGGLDVALLDLQGNAVLRESIAPALAKIVVTT